MIKNWQLFLESNDDSDDESAFKKQGEILKTNLKKAFERIFIGEYLLRLSGDDAQIKTAVEVVTGVLLNGFEDCLDRRPDMDDEFKEILLDSFSGSLEGAKQIMITKSFSEGLDMMVDNFMQTMLDIKRSLEKEGEEWKEEKEKDYSDLSKSELNALIDKALDDRDFARVKFLSQYLKESAQYNPQEELREIAKQVANLLVDFVVTYIK